MKKKIKAILKFSPIFLYEYYRNTKNEIKRNKNSQELINQYFQKPGKKRLQIGCGNNFLKGWLNTDINGLEGTVYLDAGRKFPFENDSFDIIYSEHLFEHLSLEEQMSMLGEAKRVLKNGGVLRIATPSIDFLFDLYSNPNSAKNLTYTNWARNTVPKLKTVPKTIGKESFHVYVVNNFFRDWGHKMIHNFESIKGLTKGFNFTAVKEVEVGESVHEDLRNVEQHGKIIPEHINKWETMVIEITK